MAGKKLGWLVGGWIGITFWAAIGLSEDPILLLPPREDGKPVYPYSLEDSAERIVVEDLAPKLTGLVKRVSIQPFNQLGNRRHIGVTIALANQLKIRGFEVTSERPEAEIEGRIFVGSDSGYRLEGRVVFAAPDLAPILFSSVVKNEVEAIAFAATPRRMRPDPPYRGIKTAWGKPATDRSFIERDWIKAVKDGLYGVQVLRVDSNGEKYPYLPQMHEGRPTVFLKKGEPYVLQLWNGTDYDCAARVFVDGVNRYALAEEAGHRELSDIVLHKVGRATGYRRIDGFFKNKQQQYRFLTTGPEGSIAHQLAPDEPDSIGTISVVFSVAVAYRLETARFPSRQLPGMTSHDALEWQAGEEASDALSKIPGEIDPKPRERRNINGMQVEVEYVSGEVVGTTAGALIDSRTEVRKYKIGKVRSVVTLNLRSQ